MPLHLDYRPQTFDEVVGNEGIVSSLKSVFVNRSSDYPHAILFQGPKGCGKTTMARIVANVLLGKPFEQCRMDFCQMDGGDVKADTVVSIKNMIKYRPQSAKARVYLIDESHMVGAGGDSNKNVPQNNMLTMLEEAPEHVYFIFTTTDPERLLGTIKSRCHIYEVKALNNRQIIKLLKDTLTKEEITDIPDSILSEIADVVDGCPREALKTLDQIIDMDIKEMSSAIQSFMAGDRSTADLCKALLGKQSWNRIVPILKQMDLSNPESIRKAVIGWMTMEVMKGDNPQAAMIFEDFREPFYSNGKNGIIMACYKICIMSS